MTIHIASGSTLRRDLAAVAKEYDDLMAQSMFIADRVAPAFPVAEAAAAYPVWLRESFLKAADTNRNPDGSYNRIDGELGTLTYECVEHGLETALDDRRLRLYSSFIDFEMAMTRTLRHRVLLAREKRVAALVNNAVTFSAVAAATAWSTHATAVPMTDIGTGLTKLELNTGIPRSQVSVIMPQADYINCVQCATVIAKLQYTFSGNQGIQPHLVKPAQLATILDVKEVLVAMGGYDTKEDVITPSVSAIWAAGYVTLAYLATPGQPLEMPSAFRTMRWTADASEDIVVERYRDETVRSGIVRVREDSDEVATAEADLMNYLISTT